MENSRWKRILTELNGKSDRDYKHEVSTLLMKSYAEIGAFPHEYPELPCKTHYSQFSAAHVLSMLYSDSAPDITINPVARTVSQSKISGLGVSALEFDKKGTYLASVTRSGCLTVHKFESLYSHGNASDQGKDDKKQLQHFSLSDSLFHSITSVRWNPSNQDEIAYTSLSNGELTIFDIVYSQAVQVLRKRPPVSILVFQGLTDTTFLNDGTSVLASNITGAISMWDRRVSDLSQRELTTNKITGLTSIQLLGDQYVYGATKSGFIYIWDLRGGRSSADFQSDTAHSSPLTSVNIESMLNEIIGLQKAQARILPNGIQSININPSCSYQLGFHLDDGWSGVLDMHNYRVSHIHCPPLPPWMDSRPNVRFPISPPRKPSWLLEHSIYAAASTSTNGLHLLDFFPHPSSPCHVDFDDSENPQEIVERKQTVFVPLSKRVTACAVHPLNGTIVAGTMDASVLMISQKHVRKEGDGDEDGQP